MQNIGSSSLILFLLIIGGSTLFISGIIVDRTIFLRRREIKKVWHTCLAYAKERPWQLSDILAIIMTISLSVLLSSIFLPCSSRLEELACSGIFLPVIKTLVFHGPAFIVILMIMKYRGLRWSNAFGALKQRFKYDFFSGIAFYIGGVPIIAGISLLSYIILFLLHIPVIPQDVALLFVSGAVPFWFKIYLIILAVIVAPIVEEMCFRGILLPVLLKYSNPVLAVGMVSVLFASIHFSLSAFLPLTGIAVIFALSYIYTGSLLTSIVMHAALNSVSIITLLCAQHIIA